MPEGTADSFRCAARIKYGVPGLNGLNKYGVHGVSTRRAVRHVTGPFEKGLMAEHSSTCFGQICLMREEVKRSMEWLIKFLIKLEAKVAYHVGDGMFMSRRYFPWLDTTVLCLGKRLSARFWLTGNSRDGYAQKLNQEGFFINITTLLFLLGLEGDRTWCFLGKGTIS